MVSKQLKAEFGVDVLPYSQDMEDGLYVVTRGAAMDLDDDVIEDLGSLASHVMSIDLWRREMTPTAYATLGQFTRLQALHLNETNVSAKDLSVIAKMRSLETLNLFGTSIGDESIELLSKLRSLRKLHLHKSHFTTAGVAQLRAAMPRCDIFHMVDLPELEKSESEKLASK